MSEDQNQTEISTPLGTLKASGRDLKLLLIIVIFALTMILAWLFWQHTIDAKAESKALATRLEDDAKALSGAINNLARSQREMACVISLPLERREREYMNSDSYCRRLSGMP